MRLPVPRRRPPHVWRWEGQQYLGQVGVAGGQQSMPPAQWNLDMRIMHRKGHQCQPIVGATENQALLTHHVTAGCPTEHGTIHFGLQEPDTIWIKRAGSFLLPEQQNCKLLQHS
jgi:hypothetical protein